MFEEEEINPARRGFLKSASWALGGLAVGAVGLAQAAQVDGFSSPSITPQTNHDFWSQPRVVTLRRFQNKESVQVSYWKNGQLDPNGYNQICWLMRDLRAGQHARIDPRLLDLMCAMQAWLAYYGHTNPFVVSSGYRTPHTNATTEGAARNSMHLRGKAVDIVTPDLPVGYLGKLAQHYSAGGVGFYPSRGFIHMDTGNVRSWGRR